MVSHAKVGFEYAHRFLSFGDEDRFIHGHNGELSIEVGGDIDSKTGFIMPPNNIRRILYETMQVFDHALILERNDPLIPEILKVYEQQGIWHSDTNGGTAEPLTDTGLAEAYPGCRLITTARISTCENLLEIFYEMLKDKFSIKKLTFASGANGVSAEY